MAPATLRSLELVQDFLQTGRGHGLNDEQTGNAYRSVSSFPLGQLLLGSAARGTRTRPVEVAVGEGDAQVSDEDVQI